jgi:putative transcriptional regulator
MHHPSDGTLAAYAAGTLDAGRRLVVATHLSLCRECRQAALAFEHLGGTLLEASIPTAMAPDALSRALERLETPEAARTAAKISLPSPNELPRPLAAHDLGPWRWIGRGVQWRSVSVPVENDIRVFMLRAEPGTRLPHHRHEGVEWTCILKGAYRHDLGRYGAGDFDEADDTMEHKPVVEDGVPCICLVALQGNIQLQGWIGRLLQPLVRI